MSGWAQTAMPARVEFEWIVDGKRDRRPAIDTAHVAFEAADLVQTPRPRDYEGYYWAATIGGHVWFGSEYERAALMQLDRDRRVVGLAARPMLIHWPQGQGIHKPDFFVRYQDGGAALIDVRLVEDISASDVEVFRRTAEICERLGWGHVVVSDMSVEQFHNLRFLSRYRFDRWVSEPGTAKLRELGGEERTLGERADALSGVSVQPPLGVVYSALWWGQLRTDEYRPLSLRTVARAA